MTELTLQDIFYVILKRKYILIISIAISIIAAFLYTFFLISPLYKANTTLYVGRSVGDPSKTDSMVYQELMIGEKLVNDYREIIKSRQIGILVAEKINEGKINESSIASMVDVSSKTNTRIIEISAKHTDPVLAMEVANAVADIFTERVVEIMELQNVRVIDTAVLPERPFSPNKPLNMAISLVLGIMAGIGLIFLIEYFDNTIKTTEDMHKYTGISVLGSVPEYSDEIKTVKYYNKKNKIAENV